MQNGERPFAPDSFWNTPINWAVAQPHPETNQMNEAVMRGHGFWGSNVESYAPPVYYADSTTPYVPFYPQNMIAIVHRNDETGEEWTEERSVDSYLVPWDRDEWEFSAGTDAGAVIYDFAKCIVYSIGKSTVQDIGDEIHIRSLVIEPGDGSGNLRVDRQRGLGIGNLAGVILANEVRAGHIPHVMTIAYNSPCREDDVCEDNGYPPVIWPFVSNDGRGFDRYDPPEGARLAIYPSITDEEIRNKCTKSGTMILGCYTWVKAMQEYGAVLADNSGHPKTYGEYYTTANWTDEEWDRYMLNQIPLDWFVWLDWDTDRPDPDGNPPPTPFPTPTPIGPEPTPVTGSFENGDFESPIISQHTVPGACPGHSDCDKHGWAYHYLRDKWYPAFCESQYTGDDCPADAEGNDPDLLQGRPEYKTISRADFPGIVTEGHGEYVQSWFCMFEACTAGIYQTIDVVPGQAYQIEADFRQWLNYDDDPESDLDNPDDATSSRWQICVNQTGDTFAFDESNVCTQPFHIPWDTWHNFGMLITANSSQMTVFFINERLYPLPNQDSYIDNIQISPIEGVGGGYLYDGDMKLLQKLCIVEARGMGEKRKDACMSVVSTVFERMYKYNATKGAFGLSDGTVRGTLAHHSSSHDANGNLNGVLWQFPPWVAFGCEILTGGYDNPACLDNYIKANESWTRRAIDNYLFHFYHGTCNGYLYYDSIVGGPSLCKIAFGQSFIEFHNGWGWD